LYEAVTLPFWSVATAPVLNVNCPVADPAATATLPGTTNAAKPVLLRVTTAPVEDAALDSVTVQLLLALDPSVVGLHCSEETTACAERLILTVFDVPL
jgi:hypothetical protein